MAAEMTAEEKDYRRGVNMSEWVVCDVPVSASLYPTVIYRLCVLFDELGELVGDPFGVGVSDGELCVSFVGVG